MASLLHCQNDHRLLLLFVCLCTVDSFLPWVGNAEPAFTSAGFYNWVKAVQRFGQYESSHTHFLVLNHWTGQKTPISVQLSTALKQEQKTARKCLEVIVSSIRYLAHEGLALRGHENNSGHLQELLGLRRLTFLK